MTADAPIVGSLGQFVFPLILPIAVPCLMLLLVRRLWYEYMISSRDLTVDLPLPGGGMGWPIIGETISFALQGSRFYDKKFHEHGRLFKTHLFGSPTVRVRGAENVRKILHGENDIVTSSWPVSTRLMFGGDCLTQSQGQHHTRLRKHVATAFSHGALAGYVPLVQPFISQAISEWCSKAPGGVMAYPECRSLTFRVAGKVLCGFDYSREETETVVESFEDIVNCIFCLPINVPGSTLNKGLKARDLIRKRVTENIHRKLDMDDTHDALRILVEEDTESGEKPSTEVIVANAIDLLVGGYASTASAACNTILCLSRNKHVLAKVRQELQEHGLAEPAGQLTLTAINELKYVSSVVKEILRVSPPIGAAFRKALKTFELDGKQIPAGWKVLYSIRDTVGMSDVFQDKATFDPDRFAAERSEDRSGDRYNYCIFGGGPRSCIGKSFAVLLLRMLVIELARSCTWELLRPESLRMNPLPTPHPVDGMPVVFRSLECVDHNANSVVFNCESEEDTVNVQHAP